MKIRHALMTAVASFLCSFSAAQAVHVAADDINSSVVGSTSSYYSFVQGPSGQEGDGTINITSPASPEPSTINGAIAADTMVTFTYNLSNFSSVGTFEVANASNSFGHASDVSGFAPQNSTLIQALASISGTTGTIVITNLSSAVLDFTALLFGSTDGAVTGNVAVAGVPVPASSLLFGVGLLALAGFAAYRKKQANA